MFSEEERNFLNFISDNDRILLFKQPSRKDVDKAFTPEDEKNIMPRIKNSDFVKSRHILNIVSEGAKIAIRDYVDETTYESNKKIEKVCEEICAKFGLKITEGGKKIPILLQIKD